MDKRKGAVLIGLLMFFTVLGLMATVAVLQQDTRLKRFSEDDLKLNLDAFRRGIDLYRYQCRCATTPSSLDDPQCLEDAINNGIQETANLLAGGGFVRARVAAEPANWRIVRNLVTNPSFEIDSGEYFDPFGNWQGNFTKGDGVPDGWNLTPRGAEQVISISNPGTHVISFWARCVSTTARAKVIVSSFLPYDPTPVVQVTAGQQIWKRFYKAFEIPFAMHVKLEIIQAGTTSGDTVFVDGVMLEKWAPPNTLPAGTPPAPSAWTARFNVSSGRAEQVLQARKLAELIPSDANPEKLRWWFQW